MIKYKVIRNLFLLFAIAFLCFTFQGCNGDDLEPACEVGTLCDDGDNLTTNDVFDSNCDCSGVPLCIIGDTCDDGLPSTLDDEYDSNCNCIGIPQCSVGSDCDDGICATVNDIYNEICECIGTLACEVGTTCNDGDPLTFDDKMNDCCVCEGIYNPYQGTYKVIYSDYWRIERHCTDEGPCPIPDLPYDWVGEIREIVAYTDTTLSKPGYWGPNAFAWNGEQIFYVDVNDAIPPTDSSLRVTIPAEIDGNPVPLWNGDRLLTCETDPTSFNHNRVPGQCDVMVVPDAGGSGIHRIYLTYGYITNGSGEREFYEVLEKMH